MTQTPLNWGTDKQTRDLYLMREYYTIKMNQLPICAITWMNLEHIMLSKREQTPKHKSSWTTFWKRQLDRYRGQTSDVRGKREGRF